MVKEYTHLLSCFGGVSNYFPLVARMNVAYVSVQEVGVGGAPVACCRFCLVSICSHGKVFTRVDGMAGAASKPRCLPSF
jgi:hypothetical protein